MKYLIRTVLVLAFLSSGPQLFSMDRKQKKTAMDLLQEIGEKMAQGTDRKKKDIEGSNGDDEWTQLDFDQDEYLLSCLAKQRKKSKQS